MYVLVCTGERFNLQEGGSSFLAVEHNWLEPVLGKSSYILCLGPTIPSAEPQMWLLCQEGKTSISVARSGHLRTCMNSLRSHRESW